MLTALQIFDAIAPQFATNVMKEVFVEMAEERTGPSLPCSWPPNKRNHAVALRAAHMMTMANDPAFAAGGGGGVSKKREGDVQVDYRVTAAKVYDEFPDLAQTGYGTELVGLIRANMISLSVTGGAVCGGLSELD